MDVIGELAGEKPSAQTRGQLKDVLRDALIIALGQDDALALADGIVWDIGKAKAARVYKPNYNQPESELKQQDLPFCVTTEPKKR